MEQRDVNLPEELVINIITRLPLLSIVRFKLVCRDWKSLTESAFFSDLYKRNYKKATSNWSILHGSYICINSCLEEIELNIPRESSSHGNNSHYWSFASGVIRKYTQKNLKIKEIWIVACADGLVLLCLLEEDMTKRYYIGNPVLSQWVRISSPPYLPQYRYFVDLGLVTQMHNGSLLGYKVIRIYNKAGRTDVSTTWTFQIYSSDTGEWSVQHVSCPGHGVSHSTYNPVSLNGKLHWFHESHRIMIHDFFSSDDQVRAISLPARMRGSRWHRDERRSCINSCLSPCYKKICTTSQGYFVFIEAGIIDKVKSYNVKVWKLKSDSWTWEKAWENNMACMGLGFYCVPMAINYFDIDIIYLWDLDRKVFVTCNLRDQTKSHGVHKHSATYKESIFCFESHSCVSQFVPSLQLVPIR